MKFVVSSAELYARMQVVGRIIAPKSPLPLLSCFLIKVANGELFMLAADTENTIHTTLPVVEQEGECLFALSAKTALDAMKEIPEQPITVEFNEETLEVTIKFFNGKYSLMAEDAEAYPRFEEPQDCQTVQIKSDFMLNAISRSLASVATDQARPVMTGIYFDIDKEELAVVASDGSTLVTNTTQLSEPATAPANFILPAKPAQMLKSYIAKDDQNVTVAFGERNAVITTSRYTLLCRLIEGRYPNYRGVIPTTVPHHIHINRLDILSALRRAISLGDDRMTIKMKISNGELMLSTQDMDYATSSEEILPCDYQDETLLIGFNGGKLVAIINNMDCETIVLQIIDATRATTIVPLEEKENDKMLGLIMPIMIYT